MDQEIREPKINEEEQSYQKEDKAKWYVIHTYSGHENKVKDNMEAMVQNRNMQDYILDIQVPLEEYVESKDGQRKVKERKMFPSYVLVKMIMNDESWYLVRNTRGVTGFVGPGSKPVPLLDEEVRVLGVAEDKELFGNYEVGEEVKVISGPFNDFMGKIDSLNYEKGKVKVSISMFGRDTLVELDFNQIIKK
ncbi:transcription antitermination protein nusG [Peptoniphilus asaccharolyticus DSM 20463]|uniref:Transcription termination/antitermination protein NusG n=1 Tax=Peptoniphilus asaccharolyticus DSM 20463 TaxID=573058 RepID=A0A1W1V6A1_PEPAS|nr:transcription termination/antitermination protein NusG [Peptoniphilus asaccharolyticus]MBL7575974.1 transcription termination/antitermination protein NusG [Peptoniphilus asaccharolyticus]SMB88959.1 transcription antitermination protein nusG [Peptoniphilus asaccharolyticus DSM 20463]